MNIPWEELSSATRQALRIRTDPIETTIQSPKALMVWVGDRQALIPASQVVGVGRIRPVEWMRLQVIHERRSYSLKDAKESLHVPGRPGSYFVALRNGSAQAVDGLGGFVDYEPQTLKPYVMRAFPGAILGKVRATGVRGGEAELLSFSAGS
jgi:hypothetical protein